MPDKIKNIFIVSGEASGDMHASSLIKELKKLNANIAFEGIGGPESEKAGTELLYGIKDVNFIGFSSVILNIKKIKSILRECEEKIRSVMPDAVILVDYPGFNLKLISNIRKFYDGKIIYYISPQLWAWHKNRVKIIKKYVDLMIVVFPFEVDFYDREGVKAEFVGHPLVKKIDDFLKRNRKTDSDKIRISILPGSRKDEIDRMLPVLLETGNKFLEEFDCEINILCSPNFKESYYRGLLKDYSFNLIYDRNNSEMNYKTILNSDLVITKSGTSTIECALIGTPFCVVYKTGKINYSIGKRLIRIDNIAMVNILSGKKIVKEFLQEEVNPGNLFKEGKDILTRKEYRENMISDFRNLRRILTEKDASANAAKLISNLLD
ncbi:MAG: lipid-A-disaccharide synthase [Bacteroidetes bacterium]|nr:lipid-A-disaccharide synthase [Bacteroidota bacterium]